MATGSRAKLSGGFGVVLVLLAIVGIVGYRNTTQFATSFGDLYDDSLAPAMQLARVQEALYELRLVGATFVSLDVAGRAKVKADEGTWLKELDESLAGLSTHHLAPEVTAQFRVLQASSAEFVKARAQTIALAEQNNVAESNRV